MPNIITHKIFGEEVVRALSEDSSKSEIVRIIKENEQLFYIGSNGPDFLFFHHAKPWDAFLNHDLSHIGSELHRGHVNVFYETAIQAIRKQKNQAIKERMMAYLFGHLAHWSLDQTTHPYIFYRTGDCKGKSALYHHRFESMMDTMMLKKYHNTSVSDYPYYEICRYDQDMLQAIARIYVPAIKACLGKDVKVYDLSKALDDWNDIHHLLYDPKDKKHIFLHKIESLVSMKWLISGHVIMDKVDDTYDVLNEQHTLWYHPCDINIRSSDSFIDLFNQGIVTAIQVDEVAYQDCFSQDEIKVVNLLKDHAYDSGMSEDVKMSFFDVIYEGENK
ncbi:MAG: zinc dependent phospholipase C family protein [Erysipelotrichaceae bacterium]